MKNKEEKIVITEYNINSYTIEDKETIFANSKLNKDGYPNIFPTKDIHGKKLILTFINAEIYDLKGNKVSENVGNFSVADDEEFNKDDANSLSKIEFISALLSNNRIVKGGVYFKGRYYTSKMTLKLAANLTKSFMKLYFHLEDRELIFEWFDKMGQNGLLPYWPTKSYDKEAKPVIFSAVNASIRDKGAPYNPEDATINFDVKWGDTFDLDNPEDKIKVEVIHSLFDKNKIVSGFYYKGKLIEEKLSDARKLYFEKSFIKKNFTIEHRDYVFENTTKNETGYPIFYPMKDKDNRPIICSVLDASGENVPEEYANFHIYSDVPFDGLDEDFKNKLRIIQRLYTHDPTIKGALYFDGVLTSSMSEAEVERRKEKVEKALKVFIDNNDDFIIINKLFTVEDAPRILRTTSVYDKYYPSSRRKVAKKDKEYDKKNPQYDFKVDCCNAITELGEYQFEEPVSFEVSVGSKEYTREQFEMLKLIVNPTIRVRGAVYFKGKEILHKPRKLEEFKNGYLKEFLNEEDYEELCKFVEEVKYYHFIEDKKSKMPIYWPTKDKNGREVLLSVVDADVHFKNGKIIIRASNDMNFNIYVGETFGLVGESGSGKTTISRAILGINKLAKGGIYFKGKLISSGLSKADSKKTKKNIQMIFQDPAASLNERANIDYIVSEGLYNFHMFKTNEERLEKVSYMMRQVGLLPEHLSRYPHEFSGGQRQRIGIARALVIEPQLVLADEPISALDVSIRAQVLNLLRKLQIEQSLTYLFIAHDLSIIRYISDRIAVMHKGYIVELGSAEQIYSHPLHPYTKSLLTAIPQPDPKTKDQRKKVPYNQGDIVYSECHWKDFGEGHYVLVNDSLEEMLEK